MLDEVEKHPQWLTIDSADLNAVHANFKQLGFDDKTVREIAKGELQVLVLQQTAMSHL